MKKLLAILLSMLMLCAMIPFAAVSAEGEPTIVLSTEEAEYNAGDEIVVAVNLENLASTAGLIGARVEIGFDHDVFELVTYFDEDEEVWMPQIEIATKYNASSNKYITFASPDDEGYAERCVVLYARGDAKATQVRKESDFFTATFKVKNNAVSGDYDFTVINLKNSDFVAYGNIAVPMAVVNTTVTINGTDPEPEEPACEHEYEYGCDKFCKLCGEESRPEADHVYLYGCDKYCNECGEKTNPRAVHNIAYVEAKPAVSCIQFGNVEYWYCTYCDHVWLNEECSIDSNKMAVMTAGPCISSAEHPCQNGPCVNCGMDVSPDADHIYDDNYDAECNVCGDIRVIEYVVKTFGGSSIADPEEGKYGLAFRFDLQTIEGMAIVEGKTYKADYTNATVTLVSNGPSYKLISMGALVSNYKTEKDIAVKKIVIEDEATWYAIRIINIPEEYLGEEISCTPYFVYENAEGEQITVYGEKQTASYNGTMEKAN